MAKDKEEKKNIFYSAIINAYIESSMERDRSLLYLCGGGIALLVTLMSTVGVHSICELILYIAAFLVLGTVIILILRVFRLNQNYLIQLASDKDPDEAPLKKIDSAIFILFIVGVCLLFTIGVLTSINQIISKEMTEMADDGKKIKRVDESVKDLSKLHPDAMKSLQDLAKLKPSADSSGKKGNASSDSGKTKK